MHTYSDAHIYASDSKFHSRSEAEEKMKASICSRWVAVQMTWCWHFRSRRWSWGRSAGGECRTMTIGEARQRHCCWLDHP
jgi:hypothetical protein